MASDPVLILAGPGVPGATLAAALGRNPGAWGLPALNLELEPTLDRYLNALSGLRAGQMHGLLRMLALRLGGEQTIPAVAMARRWLMRRMHLPVTHVMQEVAGLFARGRIVMPVTAGLFDPAARERLVEAWPAATLLHLRIHPRHHAGFLLAESGGAAALLLGATQTQDGARPQPDPESLWLMIEDSVTAFADLAAAPVMTLRLEDLLAAPALELGRLARALGLPDDDAAIAAMATPEASPFAGPGPFGAHLPAGISSFSALRRAIAATRGPHGVTALTGPLPWHGDDRPFRDDLLARARAQGYA